MLLSTVPLNWLGDIHCLMQSDSIALMDITLCVESPPVVPFINMV